MKILVIVAHPDDEVLGMGGTIKKLTKKGNHVKIVIMATGIAARRSSKFTNEFRYNISKKDSQKIDVQITRLRHKIEENPKQPHFIKTIRGKGYKLICNEL